MQEKLQRTFVREEAYVKIRRWIVNGTLAAGSKLKDKELAEKLGVSRTPIREALLRLEDEGLVQSKPNSSTHVSPIDFENYSNLYSIVWTLENLALSQGFIDLADEHIDTMVKANEQLLKHLKQQDIESALMADNEFHSVYIKLSKNKELEKILQEIKQKLNRLEFYYFEKAHNSHLSYEEHKQIIEALRERNLPEALRAIERNWKASFLRIGAPC